MESTIPPVRASGDGSGPEEFCEPQREEAPCPVIEVDAEVNAIFNQPSESTFQPTDFQGLGEANARQLEDTRVVIPYVEDEEELDADDQASEDSLQARQRRDPPTGCQMFLTKYRYHSLFLLVEGNKFRTWCALLIHNTAFNSFMLLCIVVNALALVYLPLSPQAMVIALTSGNGTMVDISGVREAVTPLSVATQALDMFCTVVFVVEACLKIIAGGLILHPGSYLRNAWNVLDSIVIVATVLSYCSTTLAEFVLIEALRVGRPLRIAQRIRPLRDLVEAIVLALPDVGSNLLLFIFIMTAFAIGGIQVWGNMLTQRCYITSLPNATLSFYNSTSHHMTTIPNPLWHPTYETLTLPILQPNNPYRCGGTYQCPSAVLSEYWNVTATCTANRSVFYTRNLNFDQIFASMLLSLKIMVKDQWQEDVENLMDASGRSSAFYIVCLTFVGGVVFFLFVAILTKSYSSRRRRNSMLADTSSESTWVQRYLWWVTGGEDDGGEDVSVQIVQVKGEEIDEYYFKEEAEFERKKRELWLKEQREKQRRRELHQEVMLDDGGVGTRMTMRKLQLKEHLQHQQQQEQQQQRLMLHLSTIYDPPTTTTGVEVPPNSGDGSSCFPNGATSVNNNSIVENLASTERPPTPPSPQGSSMSGENIESLQAPESAAFAQIRIAASGTFLEPETSESRLNVRAETPRSESSKRTGSERSSDHAAATSHLKGGVRRTVSVVENGSPRASRSFSPNRKLPRGRVSDLTGRVSPMRASVSHSDIGTEDEKRSIPKRKQSLISGVSVVSGGDDFNLTEASHVTPPPPPFFHRDAPWRKRCRWIRRHTLYLGLLAFVAVISVATLGLDWYEIDPRIVWCSDVVSLTCPLLWCIHLCLVVMGDGFAKAVRSMWNWLDLITVLAAIPELLHVLGYLPGGSIVSDDVYGYIAWTPDPATHAPSHVAHGAGVTTTSLLAYSNTTTTTASPSAFLWSSAWSLKPLPGAFSASPFVEPSWFNMYRLVRILRWVKFLQLKGLKPIVRTVTGSISAMGYLACVIGIVLYVYAILGMYLFGDANTFLNALDHHVSSNDGGSTSAVASSHSSTRDDYSTFWQSLLSVFIVVSGDEWILRMEEIMGRTSNGNETVAVIFFCSCFFIGHAILIQLSVAIILDTLSKRLNDLEEEDAEYFPPPLLLPRFVPAVDVVLMEQQAKKVVGDAAIDHNDYMCGTGTSVVAAQLFGTHRAPPVVEPSRSRSEAIPVSPRSGKRGRSGSKATPASAADDTPRTVGQLIWKLVTYVDAVRISGYSLFVFSPSNRLRVFVATVSASWSFDRLIDLMILANLILLIFESPFNDPSFTAILRKIDFFFLVFFTLEMLMKVVAFGAVFPSVASFTSTTVAVTHRHRRSSVNNMQATSNPNPLSGPSMTVEAPSLASSTSSTASSSGGRDAGGPSPVQPMETPSFTASQSSFGQGLMAVPSMTFFDQSSNCEIKSQGSPSQVSRTKPRATGIKRCGAAMKKCFAPVLEFWEWLRKLEQTAAEKEFFVVGLHREVEVKPPPGRMFKRNGRPVPTKIVVEVNNKPVSWRAAYLRDAWNWLDFAVVVMSYIAIAYPVFRTARALRAIRLMTRLEQTKLVIVAIVEAIPFVMQAMVVVAFLFFVLGVMGVKLMKGKMGACNDPAIWTRSECVGNMTVEVPGPIVATDTYALNLSHGAVTSAAHDVTSITSAVLTNITSANVSHHEIFRIASAVVTNVTTQASSYIPLTLVKSVPRSWDRIDYHFDHLGASILTLFEVMIGDEWARKMYFAMDAVTDEIRAPNGNPAMAIYFVVSYILCALFALNMMIGILVNYFARQKKRYEGSSGGLAGSAWLTPAQRKFNKAQSIIESVLESGQEMVPRDPSGGWMPGHRHNHYYTSEDEGCACGCCCFMVGGRLTCSTNACIANAIQRVHSVMSYRWTALGLTSPLVDWVVWCCIFVNAGFLAGTHEGQDRWQTDATYIVHTVTLVILVVEASAKVFAYGLRQYLFTSSWHIFDVVVILLGIVNAIMDSSLSEIWTGSPTTTRGVSFGWGAPAASNATRQQQVIATGSSVLEGGTTTTTVTSIQQEFFNIIRVVRLIRLMKGTGIERLLRSILRRTSSFMNIIALLILTFFLFAVEGVTLFGRIPFLAGSSIGPNRNFRTVWNALLVLYQVSTKAGWQRVMYGCIVEPPFCGPDTIGGVPIVRNHTDRAVAFNTVEDSPAAAAIANDCSSYEITVAYFVIFMIVCSLIVWELFVAVVIDIFIDDDEEFHAHNVGGSPTAMDSDEVILHAFKKVKRLWVDRFGPLSVSSDRQGSQSNLSGMTRRRSLDKSPSLSRTLGSMSMMNNSRIMRKHSSFREFAAKPAGGGVGTRSERVDVFAFADLLPEFPQELTGIDPAKSGKATWVMLINLLHLPIDRRNRVAYRDVIRSLAFRKYRVDGETMARYMNAGGMGSGWENAWWWPWNTDAPDAPDWNRSNLRQQESFTAAEVLCATLIQRRWKTGNAIRKKGDTEPPKPVSIDGWLHAAEEKMKRNKNRRDANMKDLFAVAQAAVHTHQQTRSNEVNQVASPDVKRPVVATPQSTSQPMPDEDFTVGRSMSMSTAKGGMTYAAATCDADIEAIASTGNKKAATAAARHAAAVLGSTPAPLIYFGTSSKNVAARRTAEEHHRQMQNALRISMEPSAGLDIGLTHTTTS